MKNRTINMSKALHQLNHGALQRLPYVHTSQEIQEMTFWRAKVRENPSYLDPIKRAKNQTSRQINAHLNELSNLTRRMSFQFPKRSIMHAFESELIALTLGDGVYEKQIQTLRTLYANLHNIGKKYEKEAQEKRTKLEVTDCGVKCVEELRKVIDERASMLEELTSMAKTLRALPSIDLEKPIFAFVGAPNVGKSSLVKALSTASPEVANYSFTTRGITIGHIFMEGISYQIADTPGLLKRADEKRNAIERLALAMIEKTNSSIGFVLDASETSGTSLSSQLELREEIRDRLKDKRPNEYDWIDIFSKVDHPHADIKLLPSNLRSHVISVSTSTNQGLMELGKHMREIFKRRH